MLSEHQRRKVSELLEAVGRFQRLMEDETWQEIVQAGEDSMKAQQSRLMVPTLSTEQAHYWRGYVSGINDTLKIPEHSINTYKSDLVSLGVDKHVGGTVQK